MPKRYFVTMDSVVPYSPANHTGTTNHRLIGPDTVGSARLELLHGTITAKGHGALPHAHPGIDQVVYLLAGRAVAEVDGQRQEMGPGDCCFFPADMPHIFTAISDEPVKVLVIYTPPYMEDPANVIR
jgi:mannose-6-phosphate isomerase-like protein (cupin superfamily)